MLAAGDVSQRVLEQRRESQTMAALSYATMFGAGSESCALE